jgi:hypothetical protein
VEVQALGRIMVQRHGPGPAETTRVQAAATWGRALDEPRLRAATVDWAQQLVEINRRRMAERPQLRGWLIVVLVPWGTGVLARVAFAVAQGRWGDVNWFMVLVYLAFGVQAWRRHTGPQPAIERNSGPPA